MKERSVAFYKRLILSTALIIVIVLASTVTYFVGRALSFWENDTESGGESVTTISKVQEEAEPQDIIEDDESVQQQALTEQEAENAAEEQPKADIQLGKTVYLTFEDGSSTNTSRILEVLKENGVNATFFFNTNKAQTSDEIMKKAYDYGNEIGVLTSEAGSYKKIYASAENYMADFEISYNRIKDVTGKAPEVVRFPGGSINGYNRSTYSEIIAAVENKGFTYFDWNVCADNGSANASKESLVKNGTRLPSNPDTCIVLIHDNGNANVCEALEEIISFYKSSGYSFGVLTPSVEQITF